LRGDIQRIGEVDADVVVLGRDAARRGVERRRDKNGGIKGRQHKLRSEEAEVAAAGVPHMTVIIAGAEQELVRHAKYPGLLNALP